VTTQTKLLWDYRFIRGLTLVVGIVSIILIVVLPDFDALAFMLTVSALGSLVGGSSSYKELERQVLQKSYKLTLEWLILVIMSLYVLVLITSALPGTEGIAGFLNKHWPGLILSIMCILMGLAGFRRKS